MQHILNKQQLNYDRVTVFSTQSVQRGYKQDIWSNDSLVSSIIQCATTLAQKLKNLQC
jgi:hypothetical protein